MSSDLRVSKASLQSTELPNAMLTRFLMGISALFFTRAELNIYKVAHFLLKYELQFNILSFG